MTLFSLIHGSASSPAAWDRLIPELEKLGHRCVAAELPLDAPDLGASAYAAAVAESIEGRGDDVIVVAHSSSGLILPVLADLRPVRRIVFLTSAIPKIGASFLDQLDAGVEKMFNPDWVGKDPSTDDRVAREFIFHDCDPDVARWAMARRSPWYPQGLYAEKCPLESWPDVPSHYIVCTEDRTILPEWSRRAARELLGVEPLELPGGHCPHVSRPQQLAEVLATLAA